MNMTLRQLELWVSKANDRIKAINGPGGDQGRRPRL